MKFKKWILTLLAFCVVTLGLGVFAACGEPSYYRLYFAGANGIHYDIDMKLPSGEEFVSGGEVKAGYEVKFSVVLEDGASGEPVVYANNTQLTPDADGVYSFKIKEETTVSVSGVTASASDRSVIFDKGNNHIWFYDTEGNELTTLEDVEEGDEIVFSVKISVYYAVHGTGNYSVIANSNFLTRDKDGLYRFTVHGGTTVSVREIDEEGNSLATLTVGENFTERENGGNGTAESPFRISTPADLYMMSVLVNGQEYSGYNEAYYELVNDIDLEGEQLYVIGDVSSSSAVFGGAFNGNGHTISNYTVSASYISVEDSLEHILTNVGFFGVAMPVGDRIPEIYNLKLENFTVDADCSGTGNSVVNVGGLVGYGVGVRITGCTVQGSVTATASSDGTFGYVGGVIGLLQSAYNAETETSSFASVISCASDVSVLGLNYVMAAGGVAGAVLSYESNTTAFVLNSYATGNVRGAIRAGGVAGMVFAHSSVLSSYATGRVEANTNFTDDYQSPEFAHSYAGGVVGYAENDAIVADSFSSSTTFAQASTGTSYAHTGGVIGGMMAESALPGYDNRQPLVRNSVHTSSVQVTDDYIKNTLGWDEEDWVFGDGYPTVNHEETSKTFTITLDFGGKQVDGATEKAVEASTYISMAYWYLFMQNASRLPQFVTADDGQRSYGYFFDEEHTERVPASYVPMHDVTLYAAFADYGEVAGTYYLRGMQDRQKGVSLTLAADGTLTYRNGAMTNTSYYYYDGETVTLVNTIVGIHGALPAGQEDYNYANFRATLGEHGILTVDDKTYYAEQALTAQKEFDNFFYGTYTMANASYVFYKDGTGTRTPTGGNAEGFTYYVEETALSITMDNGNSRTGTVGSDGRITAIGADTAPTVPDGFEGTWERAANAHEEYIFDGKGGFTYTRYDFEGGVRHVVATEQGTYTLTTDSDTYLSFTMENGKTYHAYFEDGFLSVEETESRAKNVYYRAGSYTGTWVFKNSREQIRLTLGGIGQNGVGAATVVYVGQSTGTYEIAYEISQNTLLFFLNDMRFGSLTFNVANRTLTGMFYSGRSGALRANTTFILYDELRGSWISAEEGFGLVEFNGEGSYELTGSADYLAVRGTVSIDGTVVGYYTLENGTMSGSFTYNGKTYKIAYDEAAGCINVTVVGDGKEFTLRKHDAWYGLELVDNTGRTYSFDGRGELEGGGKLTSFFESYTTYTYTVQPDGSVTFSSGSITGSVKVEDGQYKVVFNGDERTAMINAGFTGTWLVSGAYTNITIGEIGAGLTAEGTAAPDGEAQAVTFTYHPDGNYLTFTLDGTLYYVNISNGKTEITVGTANTFVGTVCIRSDLVDAYYGEYTTQDGRKIHFDGLGKSVYADGTAYTEDAEGRILQRYYYSIDGGGVPALRRYNSYATRAQELFVEAEDGEFVKGDTHYKLIVPDEAYNGAVLTYNGVEYYFGGNGKARRTALNIPQTCTYTCTVEENTRLIVTLTTADGTEVVTITATSSGTWTIVSVETEA